MLIQYGGKGNQWGGGRKKLGDTRGKSTARRDCERWGKGGKTLGVYQQRSRLTFTC